MTVQQGITLGQRSPTPMRIAAWVVPVALLGYAGCRWLDGRDGSHGPGLWWDIGHVGFLVCWIAFAVLTVMMAQSLRRGVYWLAAAAGLAGVGAFGWVTLTDLFPSLGELPDPLRAAGPLLFLLGITVLLGATAHRNRLRGWGLYPALAVVAVAAVAVDLAYLPITALLFIPALAPCRSEQPRVMSR